MGNHPLTTNPPIQGTNWGRAERVASLVDFPLLALRESVITCFSRGGGGGGAKKQMEGSVEVFSWCGGLDRFF